MASVYVTLVLGSLLICATATQNIQEVVDKMHDLNAMQTVYRNAVSHTNKNGRRLMDYAPNRPFFQIGTWENLVTDIYSMRYNLEVLTNTGFSTM